MKIYGISVVQNEGDIIRESLEWALRFCERIWIWDLASTDNTWDILQQMRSDRIVAERREGISFVNSVRGLVFQTARDQIGENNWIYALDADEFVVGDPKSVLASAEQEGAAVVRAWQINFFPTRGDLVRLASMGENAWATIPLNERLRHYRVEWLEPRFVRVVPGLIWDTSTPFSRYMHPDGTGLRVSRCTMMVRHYRYRSPRQVLDRHRTRQAGEMWDIGQFRWTPSADLPFYAQPAWSVRHWHPDSSEIRVPGMEMLRARAVWLAARAWKSVRRRFG
ncbi:MAG: hypothetical protein BWY59_01569 [Verrucomicrobia bacterium ADurb.Bin345]|nr:MAG: hypothetical protein BWY59_01569 [Verrucomicrobia bacterium ADurb.Bin345]